MMGITDSMRQYEESTEEVWMNKPKNLRPYGIRRPDSANIALAFAVIIVILAVISEVIL